MDTRSRRARSAAAAARQPNQLLRALSAADYARMVPHLQRVTLNAGETVTHAGARALRVLS